MQRNLNKMGLYAVMAMGLLWLGGCAESENTGDGGGGGGIFPLFLYRR
jgi:hypothetical protein